jgi:aminopeptidase N
MLKSLTTSFLLILFLNNISRADEGADIIHYKFAISLSDSDDVIQGRAEITFKCQENVSSLTLNLTNVDANGKGMKMKQVLLQDQNISFTHENNLLVIGLPPGNTDVTKTITIIYSGIPQDGLVISKNKFGDRTFFGDNWPNRAQHWLPVVDHPSDKATVEFVVTAPNHYSVVANGAKVEESLLDYNRKLTHWRESVPISTKVMVIGVARFAVRNAGTIKGVPVEHWVFPQNRLEGFYDYEPSKDVLDFFSNNIGPYPYEKLANVQSKTRFGGMENASNIFYFENSVTGKAERGNLIAHEVAHQWFGNSITEKDWHHVWLSEGFASYFTHLYNEFAFGDEKFRAGLNDMRTKVIQFSTKEMSPVVYTQLPVELTRILNANSYQKGGWFLHMLRRKIGDDKFWESIRRFYALYQNSNATTEDFQAVVAQVSGMNVGAFFNQWLRTGGHPKLTVRASYNKKTQSLELIVNQLQPQAFEFPLELNIYKSSTTGPVTEVIQVSKKTERFFIKIDQKPVKIDLDPAVNLLFEGKIEY